MSLITRDAKEYRRKDCAINVTKSAQAVPWVFSVLRQPNHLLLDGANNRNVILPNDSTRPLFKHIEIFSCILTVYFNCKYFLNIRASCYNASLGFRLLGEIPEGAIMRIFGQSTNQNRIVTSLDSINSRSIHTLRLSFVMLLIHRKGVFVERNTAMHTHRFPNLEHTKMLQKALSRNFHEIIEESP